MKKIIFVISFILITASSLFAFPRWVPLVTDHLPLYVMGTYQKGSNTTEPKPRKSKYLQVMTGGAIVVENGAGFYLKTAVIKKPEKELYLKVFYTNPRDKKKPFVNDMLFTPDLGLLKLSSPDIIPGIVGYRNYRITVKIYDNKDSKEPIDVLKQNVRSYIDTQTDQVLVFYRMQKHRSLKYIPRKNK